MNPLREMTDEVLQALSISLLAEGVAVAMALASAFVWIAIYSTRMPV